MDQIKPRILVNDQDRVVLNQHYLRPIFANYFDIVDYDPAQSYNAKEYCVMTNSNFVNTWYTDLVNSGSRLIVDNLIEWQVSDILAERYKGQAYVWSAKNYMWINEYYLWITQGYQNYQPNKQYTHRAFLAIRQLKPHRRQLLAALEPVLDQLLYSVIDLGRRLPNDLEESEGIFQRYFTPEWYDSTYFTIVSETVTYSKYPVKVSEKTFKPISFYHPFVVFGQTGTLAYLHELGFETFENLFDESYDTVEDQPTRLAQIVDNVQNFKEQAYDKLTGEKLRHNHNLFYNADRVQQMFIDNIITPILDYVNT